MLNGWLIPALLIAKTFAVPRVAFLTTSVDGQGTLPMGAHLVLEEFSRHGGFVTFHDASILYDPQKLGEYQILFVPPLYGYHDQDRLLSLSYLDTLAMRNIVGWVRNGGILVTSGNVGRNTLDGTDRYLSGEILDRTEWPLGRVFGFDMVERNLNGFSLRKNPQTPYRLLEDFPEVVHSLDVEDWYLVPVNEESDVVHLADWVKGDTTWGGILLRRAGQGIAIYLSSYLLLHPSFDGGWSDIPAITRFFHELFLLALGNPRYAVGINPWPAGAKATLCVTLDDGGTPEEYDRTVQNLLNVVPELTFFVTGKIQPEILAKLRKNPKIELGNHSYDHPFFRDLLYADALREILKAREVIGPTLGFRFPYVNYTAEGIFALATSGFEYVSTIKVDHLNTFHGALFPYNLVVAPKKGLVVTTDLLEISPVQEDWAFYKRIYQGDYPVEDQQKDQEAFASYLRTMWEIIYDAGGCMVTLGHPMYQGHSDAFLQPVLDFLKDVVRQEDVWVTRLEKVNRWWRTLRAIRVTFEEKGKSMTFSLYNPWDTPVQGYTLWVDVPQDQPLPRVSYQKAKGYLTERIESGQKRVLVVLRIPPGWSRVVLKWE